RLVSRSNASICARYRANYVFLFVFCIISHGSLPQPASLFEPLDIPLPQGKILVVNRPYCGQGQNQTADTRIFSPLALARLFVSIGRYWYLFKRLTAVSAGRFYRFEHIVTYSSGKVVAKSGHPVFKLQNQNY